MPASPEQNDQNPPSNEPIPVGAALADSPIGQILASRDARAEIEPDQPMPEQEAVAAFQAAREREQAVSQPPGPLEVLATRH